MATVYSLNDGRGRVRYIGVTTTELNVRLYHHISEANNTTGRTRKLKWIRSMLRSGGNPTISPVENNVPEDVMYQREQFWIEHQKLLVGELLTNTDAKEYSDERRKAVGAATKKRLADPEQRAKLKAHKKALSEDPVWKQMMADRMKLWHAERKAKGLKSGGGRPKGKIWSDEERIARRKPIL